MHVTFLSLRDFRSYEAVDLQLRPGATAFVGPNGHGKSNLLEAVGYVGTLGSYRVASDGPLVRAGADRAVVRASVDHGGRETLAEIEINPGRANRARLNRAPVSRLREVLGALRLVFFSPDDLALVKGDPEQRRRFLDETLVARAPRQAAVRADYERVLKQRGALLKSAAGVASGPRRRRGGEQAPAQGGDVERTLDVWDSHLARAGAELVAARLELLADLRPLVRRQYEILARSGAPVECRYVSSTGDSAAPADRPAGSTETGTGRGTETGTETGAKTGTDTEPAPDREALEAALVKKLSANRAEELERGVSLAGPHRDDLALGLGGLPARGYASQGEAWSLALALRLAAYNLLRGDGIEPVLLLDDVFAELDSRRREQLAELVAPAEQVLVTAAYAGDVPEVLAGERMEVSSGQVRRAAQG